MRFPWRFISCSFLAVMGCQEMRTAADAEKTVLSGRIQISGSSTLYLIADPIVRSFRKRNPGVWIMADHSSTSDGLKRLATGQSQLAGASRRLRPTERQLASENGIAVIELLVAYDGLAVVVNEANSWVDYLSVDELKVIWQRGSTISRWQDVRPQWPDEPIALFATTPEGGAYSLLADLTRKVREDYQSHDDDAVLARWAAESSRSLAVLPFGYCQHASKLRVVPIREARGLPALPSPESIRLGHYHSLVRPLILYVNRQAADLPQVAAFVEYYLQNAAAVVAKSGNVALTAESYARLLGHFQERRLNASDELFQAPPISSE